MVGVLSLIRNGRAFIATSLPSTTDSVGACEMIDWDKLGITVLEILTPMVKYILAEYPKAIIAQGAIKGKAVNLFAYYTFNLPFRLEDSLVVGITIQTLEDGLLIWADICEEENGTLYYSEEVLSDIPSLTDHVVRMTTTLAQQGDEVLSLLER